MKKLKLLTAICTFLVGGVNLAHAQTDVTSQYIVNADFSGTYSRFLDINTDRGVEKPLGWSVEWYQDNNDKNGMTYVAESMSQDSKTWNAKSGKSYFARMRWGNATLYLRQTLQNLRPGSYTLSFSAVAHSTNNSNSVQVSVAGQTQALTIGSNEDGTWTDYTIDFNITESTPYATIEYKAVRAGDLLKIGVDEFTLTYDGSSYYETILAKAQAIYDDNSDWAENGLSDFNSAISSNTGKSTVEDKNAAIFALEDAIAAFKSANSVDMTSKIANPNFDSNISGWTTTGGDGNAYGRQTSSQTNFTGGFLEKWRNSWTGAYNQADFDVYQQLTNLPNGEYTVNAFILAQMQGGKETLGNDYKNKKHGGPYYIDDEKGVWFYATSGENAANTWANSFNPNFGDESGGRPRSATVKVEDGNLTIGFKGIGSPSGGTSLGTYANWIACDTWTLSYFGFDATTLKAQITTLKENALALLSDDQYTNVIGTERTNLTAASTLVAQDEKKSTLESIVAQIEDAINAFIAAKTNYDTLLEELAYAKSLGMHEATANVFAATSQSTAAIVINNIQSLKEAEYAFINEAYPNDVSSLLGTWNKGNYDTTSGQGYIGSETYFDKWSGSATDLTSSATVTLPAGSYTVMVAGRGMSSTTMNLSVKVGDDDAINTPLFMNGDTGYGIDTSGATNFSSEGTYANNGTGRGWQYRYITFTSDGNSDITIAINGHLNAGTWQSFYAPVLLTTDATIKTARLAEIAAALETVPTGNMNETVKATLDSKKAAAEAATATNTKEELTTILEELNAAIEEANASITAYTAADEKLPKMLAITQTTNVCTAAALETYYTQWKTKYDNNTLTTDEANALQDPTVTTGWHAGGPAVSAFLISAWDSELNDWDGMHVNTWSAAGDFGETGFAVPLVEYWVGSGSLAAKTMTATVEGIEAGNYKVSADMFLKASATPVGVSMQVGEAAAAAITGTQNGDFFVSNATAFGTVGQDGTLTIKLIVADGNNTSWVGFKNMKFEKVNVDYADLNAAIAAANATNAKIENGVQTLTDAISAAEALLTSADQSAIDAGVTTLTAATAAAETIITARKNLAGVAKKATALKGFLADDITEEVTAAAEYAANAEATAAEADSKATALNAYFSSWQTIELTNADFNTGLNGELIEPGTAAKPYVHAVEGWTQDFTFNSTASQGIAAAYGSAAQDGTNGVAAPATDMYGKSEGGALHLSSGWGDRARYYQTIESLPAGKYVIYFEGFNANNTTAALNTNYFGLSNLTAGDLKESNNTDVFSNEKNFAYNEWKAAAFDFTLAKTVADARINVGVIGGTGGSANTPKMWFDNVVLYQVEATAMADDADYTALNNAIESAETKTASLGFENGQYAPYGNVAVLEALVAAKAIDQEAENAKSDVNAATTALTGAIWTANTEDVDAIFNGDMAIANGNNPLGWSRSNNAWGQRVNIGTDENPEYAWYYNTNGAWQYGNSGVYTMPLAANTYYNLTFSYCSQAANSNNNLTVSVLNNDGEGLAAQAMGANKSTTMVEKKVRFQTGTAGNYVLSLENNGNTYLTGVTLLKTTVADVAAELDALKAEAEALLANADYANVTGLEKSNLNTVKNSTPAASIEAYESAKTELQAAMDVFKAAKASYDNYVAEKLNAERITAAITSTVAIPATADEAETATQTILVGEYNYVKDNYNADAAQTYGMTIDKWTGTATSGGNSDTPQTNSNQKWGDAATTYYEQGSKGWGSSAWTLNYTITKQLPAGTYILKIAARASEGTNATLKATVGDKTISEPLPNKSATGKGITTSGVASFDEGEFANGGDGYGWQWRYLAVTLDEEGEVTFQIDASANSQYQWCSFGDVAIISNVNTDALMAAYNNFQMKTLGFEKDQYAPYNNVEVITAYNEAKAIAEGTKEPDTQVGVNALTATLTNPTWMVNETDVDAIYNGNFNDGLTAWTRTNNWGQNRTDIEGDYATAYYNQPGSLKYGETGAYTMPLAANTVYQLTVAYRSHENGSNNGLTLSVLNGEDGLAATTYGANGSTSEWKLVTKLFRTGAAGNYVLTLGNGGNTWMTGVSLVKAAKEETITIAENADYVPAEHYADVTFNRTLVKGWNGMVLPFDMTVGEVKDKFNASAVKDFTGITYAEGEGVTFQFADATEVKAGRPFMLKANAAGTSYSFTDMILSEQAALQNLERTAEANADVKYTMQGTYAGTTDLSDVVFALIQGDKYYYHNTGKASSAKAFRAIFVNESTIEDEATSRLTFNLDNEATAIKEVKEQQATGRYYDLQGRQVQQGTKKGFYIRDGKKVVVK